MSLLSLAEFVKGVQLAGGTTPHVSMTVASMDRQEDPLEKLWFAGCYALVYNWPTAERIFLEWRPDDFDQIDFLMWAEEHWAGIALRKERKAVYRKPFFAESAAAYLTFARALLRSEWPATYGEAYRAFDDGTRYMGRYIGIRWLEVMRRAFGTDWVMPDIHADGGEHPRKALALIYPKHADELLGGNSQANIAVVDMVASQCQLDLELEFGVKTTPYDLQSLLCEWKQAMLGRKHYPAKSVDTEVGYFNRIQDYWAKGSDFYSIREECFPAASLGEVQGWTGVRPELLPLVADHGIVWSDTVYDYAATTDFSRPVLRDPRVTRIRDLF